MKIIYFLGIIILLLQGTQASNLANPVVNLPDSRVAIGISYHLGGYTITNSEIPSLLNRIHLRLSYAPLTYLNIGADIGVSKMDVESHNAIKKFEGNFGLSVGGTVKTATPLIKDIVGLIAIGQATLFTSKNDAEAYYKGPDYSAAGGLLFHIKGVGYIAAGPHLYIQMGKHKGYKDSDVVQKYSSVSNLRGWLAIDYFPKMKMIKKYIPYFSLEFSAGKKVKFGSTTPIKEFSFSISFGEVTRRLYGEKSEVEWEP